MSVSGELAEAKRFEDAIDLWKIVVPLEQKRFLNGTPLFRIGVEAPYAVILVPRGRKWRVAFGDDSGSTPIDEYVIGRWGDPPAVVLRSALGKMHKHVEMAMAAQDWQRAYAIGVAIMAWAEPLEWWDDMMTALREVGLMLVVMGKPEQALVGLNIIPTDKLSEEKVLDWLVLQSSISQATSERGQTSTTAPRPEEN